MIERLTIFTKDRYVWNDPWGRQHDDPVLKVRMILRPETDPYIQKQFYTANNGYETYQDFEYVVPGIGTIRHNTNRVDFTGGSWWTMPPGADYVAHDKNSWRFEHLQALAMNGAPLPHPFGEPELGDNK